MTVEAISRSCYLHLAPTKKFSVSTLINMFFVLAAILSTTRLVDASQISGENEWCGGGPPSNSVQDTDLKVKERSTWGWLMRNLPEPTGKVLQGDNVFAIEFSLFDPVITQITLEVAGQSWSGGRYITKAYRSFGGNQSYSQGRLTYTGIRYCNYMSSISDDYISAGSPTLSSQKDRTLKFYGDSLELTLKEDTPIYYIVTKPVQKPRYLKPVWKPWFLKSWIELH